MVEAYCTAEPASCAPVEIIGFQDGFPMRPYRTKMYDKLVESLVSPPAYLVAERTTVLTLFLLFFFFF